MLIVALLVLAFVLGYCYGWRRRWVQAHTGEAAVRRVLLRQFPGPGYHLLNHVTLPSGDGTTEIDHVLVARSGIFVIETKHYSGTLLADPAAPQWTKIIGMATYAFQNPLRQNYKHLKAMQQLLAFVPAAHIHALVVFTGNARFRTARPVGVFDLPGVVRHIQDWRTPVLTEQHMEWCVGRLECQRYRLSRQTDVEHHAYLVRKFGDVP
jgi:hypothetical protein